MPRLCSIRVLLLFLTIGGLCTIGSAQENLLVNGGFEDVNTCTEYRSECGVEGWFYLKDVKAQMLANDDNKPGLGKNSFGLYYSWNGYTGFTPLIGALLPCGLQAGKKYTFTGMISAKLNNRLELKPGITTGKKFFVPKRPFSQELNPDTISQLTRIPSSDLFRFEYSFTATGDEKYLTFGTFIKEDSGGAQKKLIGVQTISLLADNFQLLASDNDEVPCVDFDVNKAKIYGYDFRHKEMDYSLYGKGELDIPVEKKDSSSVTTRRKQTTTLKADTLKLGDVFFDFNKAELKPAAVEMLAAFFSKNDPVHIDSIYIEGHTDSIGTDQQNMELSYQRCQSVRDWLTTANARMERIEIHPFGRSRPVATNQTAKGRSLNRRVEIIILRSARKTPRESGE